MKHDGVRKIKGKEYVTAKVFAERMNTTPMTISRYLKAGKIEKTNLIKGKVNYFDWEEQKVRFLAARDKAKHITRKESRPIPKDTYMDFRVIEPNSPDVKEPSVTEPSVDDVLSGRSPLDSIRTAIDPEQEQDCWVTDIKTGERVFSWEVCEKKYRAIILSMKARQQAGELIEKKDIDPALMAFGTLYSSSMNSLKFRMTPLIVAWAEQCGATIKPENEIYLKDNVMDPEYTRAADDMRSELKKLSEGFSDTDVEKQDGELDS